MNEFVVEDEEIVNVKEQVFDVIYGQQCSLERLCLRNVGLKSLTGFPCLPELQFLDVSENPLLSELPQNLCELTPKLVALRAHSCRLNKLPDRLLRGGFPLLQSADFHDNRLSTETVLAAGPEIMLSSDAPCIRSLDLAYNRIDTGKLGERARVACSILCEQLSQQRTPNQALVDQPPFLFIGGWHATCDADELARLNIRAILSIGCDPQLPDLPGMDYMLIQCHDIPSCEIRQFFYQAHRYIFPRVREEGVLVHCAAGRSRSASIVIASLLIEGIFTSFEDALASLKLGRPECQPNLGFIEQLQQLSDDLNKT